jgi:hypothetical protein
MATLGDMKARIAAELLRDDLTTQIANAINSAIGSYQMDHFYFNEPRLDGKVTFNTVVGKATYGSETLAQIPLLGDIDWLTYTQGGTVFQISRDQTIDIDLMNQNGQISGPPEAFTYAGDAITITPVPDNVYPIAIFGTINYAAPASDTETGNVWMNEAEVLIRCRAKFEIAVHVTRNATLMALMSPDDNGATARAFKELKQATNKKVATGRIEAMPF